MPDFSQHLMNIAASRMADHIWSIRDTSLQAYLGTHASGGVQRLVGHEASLITERQGGIAVFRAEGILVPHAEWRGEVGSLALASSFQAAERDDDIAGGILLANSPGGVCYGMLEAVQAAASFASAKPLICHVAGCCCSAAYELASQAEKIFAGPRDDIGSIGTKSLIYDFSKYFAELGVEAVSADTGPIKSIGVLGLPVTEPQRAFQQERVDFLQSDFQSAVMRGRGWTAEQFGLVATGAWWFGEQAVELGLIDGIQSEKQSFAGLESALSKTSVSIRSNPMADKADKTNDQPQPATTAELKKTFPNSTAEWREAQTEAGNTLAEASVAYAQAKEEELEKSKAAQAEAEEKAQAAEKKASEASSGTSNTATKKKGNTPVAKGGDDADDETVEQVDYVAMAKDLAKEKSISYRQAAHLVQKQHGMEARDAFKRGQLTSSQS